MMGKIDYLDFIDKKNNFHSENITHESDDNFISFKIRR